ncbi:Hypothetical predicted protein [Lecanosticta acicola]|uniref:N-acetyltransferase domain-containing protein n=1 Tax=Lecanosticta acicola TaxID=111012 RepID=A0AAI8Z556_9PEZI|nr:Hypothetical predicted protein [Lecanosticta acicola]
MPKYRGPQIAKTGTRRAFEDQDREYTLQTDLEVFQYERWGGCVVEIRARFYEKSEGDDDNAKEEECMGYLTCFTVDKRHGFGSPAGPTWQKHLLQRPSPYPYNPFEHTTDDNDPLEDMQKVLQLLYTTEGSIRMDVQTHEDILHGDTIHYIHTFHMREDHWGTGIARVCMKSFLDILSSIQNESCLHVPVVLSPAGLTNVWEKVAEECRADGAEPPNLLDVKNKLKSGYKKDGFEIIWAGHPSFQERAITVMGQSITRRTALPREQASQFAETRPNLPAIPVGDAPSVPMQRSDVERYHLWVPRGNERKVAPVPSAGAVLRRSKRLVKKADLASQMSGEHTREPWSGGKAKRSPPPQTSDPGSLEAIPYHLETNAAGEAVVVYKPNAIQYAQMRNATGTAFSGDFEAAQQTGQLTLPTGASQDTPFRIVKPPESHDRALRGGLSRRQFKRMKRAAQAEGKR